MNSTSKPRLLRNLQIGFGLSLLILVVTSVASYSSIRNLLLGSRLVDHTDSVISELNMTLSTLKDAETGQRGYLLSNDTAFLRPYWGSRERSLMLLDRVQRMTLDNPIQQQNCKELKDLIFNRLAIMQEVIEEKRKTGSYTATSLEKGREYMNEVRDVVQRMQDEEHQLLVIRTEKVESYASYAPVLIIAADLMAMLLTVFFYGRVHRDFLERHQLYSELEGKERDTARRIEIISGIADQISEGHYQTRVSDEQKDALGGLSGALNRMAESLDSAFRLLSDKEWMKAGMARLSEVMAGETGMQHLSTQTLAFIAEYVGCEVGAFYVLDSGTGLLGLSGNYALAAGGRKSFRIGDGLVGQVAAEGRRILFTDLRPSDFVISLAAGDIRPRTIIAFPIVHEKIVTGVIELGTTGEFSVRELEFFDNIAEAIGMAVASIESRLRLQELLEQTQAQTEELQAQHSELEALNLELETQTEKLQVNEEELKVQQEELLQTNHELEERSRTLEEKNQLILIRNLDIQKKAEELALTTKYKSEFMANMSHELRTPLNSILLLSRLLVENTGKNLTDEQTEYARVIQNSGHGLLQLIDEILDLSRIESGKLQLEHTIVSVREVLDDMRMLFGPMAKDKNLQLNILVDEGTPAQMETDKMRLEQILKNLLANAFKFTHKGSITLQVRPSGREHFLEFIVRDTGIGIPEDRHQMIFEAFQQADGSTRRKYGGTGLGLSISREFSRLLGGEISLTSHPDEGSEFMVTLPEFKTEAVGEPVAGSYPQNANVTGVSAQARPVEEVSSGLGYTLPEAPSEIPDDRSDLHAGDRVLLIVEDDTFFAQSLLEFSRKKGYKGIVAVSGDTAIRLARQYQPMGILLDIQLPVKNGWEVMEELKKDPGTRSIPVHIMSSFEVRNESLLKGAVNFVHKPLAVEDMEGVFGKIESLLRHNARKVIIVEDDIRHAQALAYFLGTHDLRMEIAPTIEQSSEVLQKDGLHGVILSRENGKEESDTLEMIRRHPVFENVPIIVFTGMNTTKTEEARLRQFADSIVVKTAHSYQRVLDEVSLFLHVVGEGPGRNNGNAPGRLGALDEVLKGKTVLVADDDVRNIFSLTKALERHKMRVVSAMDGQEALTVMESEPVDIVLMDMMMPEMDGFEAITRIRRKPRQRNLPILAVTAKAMAGDRERCIQAGASDYISKPVDIDQLLSLLRIWLYEK
ncbi:MAG TPA: response regulator [Puia sp.]|jgi:signal transduction histidine kinase/DNA-binding response OmpR family regulator/CHASE3 domain sensor protein|nr:response regulator [Puia sp.]